MKFPMNLFEILGGPEFWLVWLWFCWFICFIWVSILHLCQGRSRDSGFKDMNLYGQLSCTEVSCAEAGLTWLRPSR